MDQFQLPEDLTAVEDLDALLAQAVEEFDTVSGQDTVTPDDMARLRELKGHIDKIKAEATSRLEAAEEAAKEIEDLQKEVHGQEDTETDDDEAVAEDADEGADDDGGATETTETADDAGSGGDAPAGNGEGDGAGGEVLEGELVVASSSRPLNVGAIRSRQPKQPLPAAPEKPKPGVTITAAADVPGFAIGQTVDIEALTSGVISRAKGLASAKRPAQALVASYQLPFKDVQKVLDAGSTAAGTSALVASADQRNLPGGDLVASGGWCAPSETIYDIADVACPDMLWDAPEVQLTRGGIRYFKTPTLDVSQLTWVHTETDDIAGAEKPCFQIPCLDPEEVRCDAIGVCLSAGILTEAHFPELVEWYVRNSMVAHEIRIASAMFQQAISAATNIDGAESAAAFTAVFGQVALRSADMIERHSLCEGTAIEVVFPWWARNLFLADIARQNGRMMSEIDPAVITAAFATLGVSVQFARGLPPAAGVTIGAADPAAAWPDAIPFLMYPAGAFEIGRGADVNFGAVYDSEKFKTNDYTALFTEECVALVDRGPEAQFVTVPVCPDGSTGAQFTGVDCPIDAGTVVS